MLRRTRRVLTWMLVLAMFILAACSGKTIDPNTGAVKEPEKKQESSGQTTTPQTNTQPANPQPTNPQPSATPPIVVATPNAPAPGSTQPSGPVSGGTLRLYYPNVATIDPQLNSFGLWLGMDGLFEGLVRLDEAKNFSDVRGALAESWDISADRKTYTFHLHKNAKWSNGDPVTADDFVFAYRRLIDPATKAFVSWGPTYLANYQDIKDGKKKLEELGARAIDANTLELTLQNPASDFLITLALPTALPVPKKVIETHGTTWTELSKFASNGPFKLDKYELNTKIELVPNPNYWGEKPHLDRVVLYLNSAQLIAYENDEADIMQVGIQDLDVVKNDDKLKDQLTELGIKNYDLINFPVNSDPAAHNRYFRQALAMSIDKAMISSTVMKNINTPAWVTLPEGVPGHDDSLGLPFDIAKAKAALAQAGFPDGQGAPPIHFLVNGVNPPAFVLAIKDAWEKNLGLKVEIEALESGAFAQKRNAIQPMGQVTVFTTAFQVSYPSPRVVHVAAGRDNARLWTLPADERVKYQETSAAAGAEKDPAKKAALLQENIDRLMTKSSPEAQEYAAWNAEIYAGATPERELELVKKLQAFDRQSANLIPLFWQKAFIMVKPDVMGLKLNPFMNGRFYFADVWLDPSKQ